MAQAKKQRVKGVALLSSLMQRADFAPTRKAEYKRGAQITFMERFKAIHGLVANHGEFSYGAAFLTVPENELKDRSPGNTFANAIWDILTHGQDVQAYTTNGVHISNIQTSAEGYEKLRDNIRYFVVTGRMLLEIEKGFAPYFYYAVEDDGALLFYRCTLNYPVAAILAKSTVEWIRQMHGTYRQHAYHLEGKGGMAKPAEGPSTAPTEQIG